MRKILKIARREYAETVKTKTFVIGVLMAPVIVAGIIFFTGRMAKGKSGPQPALRLEVVDLSNSLSNNIEAEVGKYNESHANRQIKLSNLSARDTAANPEEEGRDRLRAGKSDIYAVADPNIIDGNGEIRVYTYKLKASSLDAPDIVRGLLWRAVVDQRCEAQEISSELLDRIRNVPMKTIEVGQAEGQQKVQRESDKVLKMMVPFCFMYLMFMGMIGTGQHMVSSVIEEKGSRVIEVLLSAVSPFELMAGKILGLAGIGLTVVGIWGAAAYGAAQYRGIDIPIPTTTMLYFFAYFIPGFLLFTSLLAGVGSVCNTIKETQGLMMPIMLVFVLPLLSWFKLAQEPDGLLARVLSFVPPLTPLVMILRISASDNISSTEILLSLVVLTIGLVATMWAAAKIFRVGILMYGKRPGVREILRWMRQA